MSGWEKAFHALFWVAVGLLLVYVAVRASGLFGLVGLIADATVFGVEPYCRRSSTYRLRCRPSSWAWR